MEILDLKLFLLRDRICAWEFSESSGRFEVGMARPYKRLSSLDRLYPSDFTNVPYSKKQLKAAPYIDNFTPDFIEAFSRCDRIMPFGDYENAIRQSFGEKSAVYTLYKQKAQMPRPAEKYNELYIDFEAVDMKICGWYAVLVTGDERIEYEGIANPFTDEKKLRRKYESVYSQLLPYSIEDIVAAPHIERFQNYFIDMFRQAKKIYTYGDTDALFVKHSFGDHIYNFFKVRNVDMSVKLGNRNLSLDKTCKLFGIKIDGEEHDPKIDVEKMMAYMEATKQL
ncbi:MAG: hypothetical protein E7332_09160 [Clostridiales bacterium]|nr:hypothetical protein [Clostridiales bacterium]